jgi:hypothetical protein
MTELSDYKRMVEAPMVTGYDTRIRNLSAENARLTRALEDARCELIVGCAFAQRGQPNHGIPSYPSLAKRMFEASERAAEALDYTIEQIEGTK